MSFGLVPMFSATTTNSIYSLDREENSDCRGSLQLSSKEGSRRPCQAPPVCFQEHGLMEGSCICKSHSDMPAAHATGNPQTKLYPHNTEKEFKHHMDLSSSSSNSKSEALVAVTPALCPVLNSSLQVEGKLHLGLSKVCPQLSIKFPSSIWNCSFNKIKTKCASLLCHHCGGACRNQS